MIDPHVHLRDFNQKYKETVAHGIRIAWKAGLDAVFEMPNTDPPLISQKIIAERLALSPLKDIPLFHGVYGGLTQEEAQIREMVNAYRVLFPRVVGLKLFAGSSTGNLGITAPEKQQFVFRTLAEAGFDGVLAVHCEKESMFRHDLYDPENPFSYTKLRPPESETQSIGEIIRFAEQVSFKGMLHICHISTGESVHEVEQARQRKIIRITCGLTPHHALLCDEHMKDENGYLLKMNPPLRPRSIQKRMLILLFEGKIDWIETDHAPHTRAEKQTCAGIPGLPFYPHFLKKLIAMGMTDEQLAFLTHTSICNTFRIDIRNTKRTGGLNLENEYEFDPYKRIR
jgi:dihydroorotase